MAVNAGAEAEYERRHNPIWKDLEQVLFDHGVSTYSIFLDPVSRDLFAYVELESEEQWRRVDETDTCQRWWRHMRDLMPANADSSPLMRDLREVFHLDRTESGVGVGEVVAPVGERVR